MAFLLTTLWRDRRGQDLMEYALMGALVASITVAIVPQMFSIAEHIHALLLAVVQAAADVPTVK